MHHLVILAGGGGTRLWPASRRRRPKQLLALGAGEGESLLAATARRAAGVVPPERTLVVTATEQIPAVRAELPALPEANLLGEPCARNTAAAVGLAAVHVLARDPEATLGILPADHHIGDEARFQQVVAAALDAARTSDAIVTIGILPVRPDTGFGYLQLGPGTDALRPVARFVEKPDRATAERYVREGYLWNAGMFFFNAARLMAELETHLPATAAGLRRIAAGERAEDVYPTLPGISIDYGVMEKTRTPIHALQGDFGWNDVGAWSALAEVRPADAAGNVTAGRVIAHEAVGNIVIGDADTLVAVVGVKDLVVVKSGNAILVVPRDRAQDVREIVRLLEAGREDAYL